jgi:hypothetical protein
MPGPGGGPLRATDLGLVTDHFDVVPVGTDDESGIVVPVVVRTAARRTIVLATRLQSRAMEAVDLLAIHGLERRVKMRRLLAGLEQAQGNLVVRVNSMPYVGDPSETTTTPSGSSAFRKNALLAA